MASITVINKTNGPINSATPDSVTATISSVRNIISPNEFYVHSAAVQYDLVVRHYTGYDSLFESNWSRVGEVIGRILVDLAIMGLTFIGIGAALGAIRTAVAGSQIAAQLIRASTAAGRTIGMIVDATFMAHTINEVAFEGKIAGDAVHTNIHGHEDNIFVVEGGAEFAINANGTAVGYLNTLTLRKITREEFNAMKNNNEIYEISEEGYPIFIENGQRYYLDPENRKIFNPDGGDEYYVENGIHVPYNRKHRGMNEYPDASVTHAATKNDSGQASWDEWVYTIKGAGKPNPAEGIEVINDPGSGIVNARLLYDDGYDSGMSYWTREEMGSNNATHFPFKMGAGDPIEEIHVREEAGYGIIDIRLVSRNGRDSGWIVGNNFDAGKKKDYLISADIKNSILVGLQGKEQGSHGLVDIRFKYVKMEIKSIRDLKG